MPEVATRPENARQPTVEVAGMPAVVGLTASGERVAVPPASLCANCGTILTGPFCSQCGQHDKDYHRSLWRFFTDFLDNFLCWDNKFLLTVQPLLRQPGFLTQEFMAGRRARYVHPLRLFLFTSAACLALIGFINHHLEHTPATFRVSAEPTAKKDKKPPQGSAKTSKKPSATPASAAAEDTDDANDDAAVKAVPAASAGSAIPGQPAPAATGESLAAKIQQVLTASASGNGGMTAAASPAVSPVPVPSAAALPATPSDPGAEALRQAERVLREKGLLSSAKAVSKAASRGQMPPVGFDAEAVGAKIEAAMEKKEAAMESVDKMRAQKVGKFVGDSFNSEQAGRMAEQVSRGVEQKLSWVSLALLPVFALLLRAVYWREDSYYFVHFVYSLHYHTFLFLFWAAYASAGLVLAFMPFAGLWGFLLGLCLLLPGWYLYLSLRRMYGESPRRTAGKVIVLGILHLVAIAIGVISVGAMAFFSTQG